MGWYQTIQNLLTPLVKNRCHTILIRTSITSKHLYQLFSS